MTTLSEAKPSVRDVRVDHVGYVEWLDKKFADPLRPAIRGSLLLKEADRAEGDAFYGSLVGVGSVKTEIDPAKFLKLLKDGTITEKEFLGAITVRVAEARRLMSDKALDKISDKTPATPSLRIARLDDTPLAIADAIAAVAAAIGPAVGK